MGSQEPVTKPRGLASGSPPLEHRASPCRDSNRPASAGLDGLLTARGHTQLTTFRVVPVAKSALQSSTVPVARGAAIASGLLLCSLMSACGAGESTSPNSDDVPTAPACGPGEVAVAGRLDGVAVTERASFTEYGFVQLRPPSTFEVFNAPVAIRLEWPELLANGQTAAARGSVRASAFDVGNCSAGPFSGEHSIDTDGGGGRFLLRELHRSPYCSGAPVRGAVAGCYRYPVGRRAR